MARPRQALLILMVTIAVAGSGMGSAHAADPPAPRPWETVDPAVLSETAQYVFGMPSRLAAEYPDAFAGVRFEGQLNDAMVIQIVEDAPGVEELKAEVERVRQYSLDRTGIALTYSYEAAPISRARRMEVHTQLAADLASAGPLADAGLIGFRQDPRGFTLEALRRDRRALASEVRARYPGVAFRLEALRPQTPPSKRFCAKPASAEQAGSGDSARSGASNVQAHLEFENRCVPSGATTEATVVIENNTGKPLEYRMCGTGSPYQAHLKGGEYEQDQGGWNSCFGTVQQVPVGASRWPVRIYTSYSQCSPPEAASLPPATLALACVRDAPQELPAARYQVVVEAADTELPVPAPVKIWVR